jgi:hypothetical protein
VGLGRLRKTFKRCFPDSANPFEPPYRFSLLALFIAFTTIAVFLALLIASMRQ